MVLDRDSAEDPGDAARVAGAGLMYLSGGSPATSRTRSGEPAFGRPSSTSGTPEPPWRGAARGPWR